MVFQVGWLLGYFSAVSMVFQVVARIFIGGWYGKPGGYLVVAMVLQVIAFGSQIVAMVLIGWLLWYSWRLL